MALAYSSGRWRNRDGVVPTGLDRKRESWCHGERARVAGIPPRPGRPRGGVAVSCSEIAGWGLRSPMDASDETAEESGADVLERPASAT